jgi:tetratricopeptide (TPR) repeat protein
VSRPGGGGSGTGGNRPGGGSGPSNGLRPGGGGSGERWPNAGNRPDRPGGGGSGERWPNAGNRPDWANRPGAGGSGERWPNAGNRPDWANRPGGGGSGERWPNAGNRPNWANRPGGGNWNDRPNNPNYWANNGNINRGNNIFNQTNNNFNQANINQNNFTSNRFNNFNGGTWGYNHYQPNWSGWHAGSWSNWNTCPAAWYGAGAATAVGSSLLWGSGASYAYSNPFYVNSSIVDSVPALDYSQPIQVPAPINLTVDNSSYAAPVADASAEATAAPSEPAPQPPAAEAASSEVPPEVTEHFDAARSAFKNEDYGTALQEVEAAIKLLPKDTTLHEFRALVLFAQGKYKEAASGIYAVLSVGPGWNWETLSALYAKPETYTKQLRGLESYVRENLKAADGRFLLAYQYLVLGNVPEAVKQLQEFEKVVPSDELAPQLVKAFTEPADSSKPKAEAS